MEEYQIDMPALTGRIDRLLAEQKLSAARMARDLGFSSGLYSQWKKGSGTAVGGEAPGGGPIPRRVG